MDETAPRSLTASGTTSDSKKAQKVTFAREWIQKSEAGGRPAQLTAQRAHPIVQTAIDVLRFLDVQLIAGREALPRGSTDANVGVVNKIPSISVGRSRGGAGARDPSPRGRAWRRPTPATWVQ